MTPRKSALSIALAGLALLATSSQAQAPQAADAAEARAALVRATADQRLAAARAGRLEAAARQASVAADRTAQAAAALAARIQQAEAGIAAGQARIALFEGRRAALRERLAIRQQPLVRLTGALQMMARRPMMLSVLRPGSVRDAVHLRAVLDTMTPAVQRQTAGLRQEFARARALAAAVRREQGGLRGEQRALAERRGALTALETRQRLASRAARGDANREADRAQALAEEARDLTGLIGAVEQAGALRRRLAALPGPVLRPAQPASAQVRDTGVAPPRSAAFAYILPVAGTVATGFGEASNQGGMRAQGLTLATRAGAQVVAPAAGRVAFAGRYAGYGRIVIIEHDGGWTTLLTGLAATAPSVGDRVVQGAPLGTAGPRAPRIAIELRKDGRPVDVLAVVAGSAR